MSLFLGGGEIFWYGLIICYYPHISSVTESLEAIYGGWQDLSVFTSSTFSLYALVSLIDPEQGSGINENKLGTNYFDCY